MNYFEHHIGDYDKNTAHLTACEDGIYHRLLRRYYDKERPLDLDVTEVKRIVRARTRDEKKAVDDVLREFFFLADDGWHHEKCDAAIAEYLAGEPEREVKKANEDNRVRRHREERSRLFKVITDAGEHASWNAAIADLRNMAERITRNAAETATGSAPATQPATAPATPATATHTPVPIPHSPSTTPHPPSTSIQGGGTPPPSPLFAPEPSAPPPAPKPPPPPRPRTPAEPKPEAPTAGTWRAYAEAYEVAYGTPPVRNQTVNGQLANFVKRIGADESPAVAAFYVRSRNVRYVNAGHSVGMLVMDAEKLRTEWATGRQRTAAEAQQVDRTATNANAFAPLIAAAEERERNAHR